MTSKRHIQINWQLPNVPIWVNVAGPRGAGKRHLAMELFKCCGEKVKRGWGINSIALFFPGNVGRFIASKIDLTKEQDIQLEQAREYFRDLRERIESGSKTDLELIAGECAVWKIDIQNVEEHLISRFDSALIERSINSFEYDKPIRENLRQILKRVRDFLSDNIQAQLIISANPGHFPTSTLNFFLIRSQEFRVNSINEMNGAGDVVSEQDQNEAERVQGTYEPIQSDEENDYDPSARLSRYPGHFVPIRLGGSDYDDALSIMRRDVEAIVDAQLNIRKNRQQLIQLLELDRKQTSQGTFSILLLKGGGFDKFYGAVNAAILHRLTNKGHFELVLGCRHEVSLDQALTRWNFLEKRMQVAREKFRQNSRQTRGSSDEEYVEILDEVLYLMQIHDHWRLQKWLKQLDSERSKRTVDVRQLISKVLVFLKYVTTTSQYILIRRRSQREDIVRDWGLSYGDIQDGINRAVDNGFFDIDDIPHLEQVDFEEHLGEILDNFDEQEFVKLILIGSAGEGDEQGNGIRSLVWSVLRAKPYSWIEDLIEADLSIDDFASIVNGIHGPNGPRGDMELQREVMLLPVEDVVVFSSVLSSETATA